jgi:DNA-binding transcriptional LysR family regulator
VVRTLAGLEKSLGVRLLNRTTRRISLTEEGRHYVERCRRILAEVQDTEHALNAKEQAPSGLLKVTAPVAPGSSSRRFRALLNAIVACRWT